MPFRAPTLSLPGLCVTCGNLQDEMGQPIGPSRVWLSDAWMPGLAMSRSLGDTLAASCGVTCCPDVSVVHITPADALAIWASDGVWEFISSQDAVSTVADCADAAAAAQLLVALAQEQWARNEADVSDDISCAVVFFSGHGAEERASAGGDASGEAAAGMADLSLAGHLPVDAIADGNAGAGSASAAADTDPVVPAPDMSTPAGGGGGIAVEDFGIQGAT